MLHRLLKTFITFTFPVLIVLISVRLVMTPAFLHFEYNRPGFPQDPYGLTREDRLMYAPYAIEYLLNGEDVTFLGDLRFPDGTSLFNTRELRHMYDVKVVTQYAYGIAFIVGAAVIIAGTVLWRRARAQLWAALFSGSLLTLGIIAAIVIVAIVNWDFFFVSFHQLFFENDTWYFAYSDTLIRLFPEQFWFDAALLAGGVVVCLSGLTLLVAWRRALTP